MGSSAKKLLLAALSILVITSSAYAGEWFESITIKGDLRHRFEWIGQEKWYNDGGTWITGDSLATPRYRNRLRGRLEVKATPEDNLEIGMRLVTGGDDPVSTNQTFDGAFTSKGFMLDRAYFNWKIVNGLWLEGGKYGPAWETVSGVFWDGDLAVEGASLGWDGEFGSVSPFVNANYLWVDEISGSPDDLMLLLGQGGGNFSFGGLSIMVAANYFTYTNIQGHGVLYGGDFFGNSSVEPIEDSTPVIDPVTLDTTGWDYVYGDAEYEFGYDVIQPSLKVGFKIGEFPISLYADLVANINSEVTEENMGYMFGLKLGKVSKPGSFELGFDYGALQEDCTNATFVDSDFAGGGTDGNGMKFSAAVGITKKLTAGVTVFANGLNPNNSDHAAAKYYRFQGDLAMKF
ncbi:putative porin [candidate division WOR-3 bacterium]|nr:putative porin [candidate division WOR-3 bacterium]